MSTCLRCGTQFPDIEAIPLHSCQPPQADAKVHLGPPPLTPEGLDAMANLRALHAEACALMDHSTGGSRSHAFFQRAAVTFAVFIEAMTQAGRAPAPQATSEAGAAKIDGANAPSSPEGIESDARRLMQAAIRYGQLVAIGRILRDMDRDAASQGSFHERDEIDRTARASAEAMSHCMTLMAKFQSSGAPAPLPTEVSG